MARVLIDSKRRWMLILVISFSVVNTSLSCPSGWDLHSSTCYHVITAKKSHSEAVASCESSGAFLVEITSSQENEFVRTLAKAAIRRADDVWFYCSDKTRENTWRCGEDNHGMVYENWRYGEPNNHRNEDCGTILLPSGFWNDKNCDLRTFAVCEYSTEIYLMTTRSIHMIGDEHRQSYCMQNHVIKEVPSPSLLSCASCCLTTPGCSSINVFREQSRCQLNNASRSDAPNDYVTVVSCVYFEGIWA